MGKEVAGNVKNGDEYFWSDKEINDFCKKYQTEKHRYEKFEKTLKECLCELTKSIPECPIRENDIDIRTRTKSIESFGEKIRRKSYADPFKQTTDMVGARIMLTSLRYVESIFCAVKEKFSIDSVCVEEGVIEEKDKYDELKKEKKFGYLGRHILIRCSKKMKDERFHEFEGMTAEIQIKTLLQHTWAEIEHKLRYKPQVKLGDEKQRYFDRLAAMIEVADDMFRDLILEWERIDNKKSEEISKEINQIEEKKMAESKNDVDLLDSESILLYLSNEKVKSKINRLKNQVEDLMIFEKLPEFIGSEFVSLLDLAGIGSVRKLNELFESKKSVKILQEYIKYDGGQTCFDQINVIKMLVYAQLSEKDRDEAKNTFLIHSNMSRIIDVIWPL